MSGQNINVYITSSTDGNAVYRAKTSLMGNGSWNHVQLCPETDFTLYSDSGNTVADGLSGDTIASVGITVTGPSYPGGANIQVDSLKITKNSDYADLTNGLGSQGGAQKITVSAAVPLVSETENLTVNAISSGDTHTVTNDGNMSGGKGDMFTANATNDYIEYAINITATGTYNIKVKLNKNNNRGKYQLAIDETNQGAVQDTYSSTSNYVELDLGNNSFSTTGNHLFRFKCTGKNSSSSEYRLFTDYIKLTKQ